MRYSYTLLPMPQSVIDCVNIIGEGQPSGISFHDRFGRDVGDSDPDLELSSSNYNNLSITGVYNVDDNVTEVKEAGVVETPNPIESVSDKSEVAASDFEPDFESDEEIAILDDEQSEEVEPPLVDRVVPRQSSRLRKPVYRYES